MTFDCKTIKALTTYVLCPRRPIVPNYKLGKVKRCPYASKTCCYRRCNFLQSQCFLVSFQGVFARIINKPHN